MYFAAHIYVAPKAGYGKGEGGEGATGAKQNRGKNTSMTRARSRKKVVEQKQTLFLTGNGRPIRASQILHMGREKSGGKKEERKLPSFEVPTFID